MQQVWIEVCSHQWRETFEVFLLFEEEEVHQLERRQYYSFLLKETVEEPHMVHLQHFVISPAIVETL